MKKTAEIIAFEPDLLFSSKIESVCKNIGVNVKLVGSLDELREALSSEPPKVLLINLDFAQGELSALKQLVDKESWKTIGYYSHVKKGLAEEANRLGIDTVIPRGTFAGKLKEILSRTLSTE